VQLNQATDYAFRVVQHLAGLPDGSVVSGQVIAEQQKITPQFLQKIMRSLTQAGLVRSHRGTDGGFELARPAQDITLLHVIEAMQGPISLNRCLAEQNACSKHCAHICPVHAALGRIQNQLVESLGSVDFASLARKNGGKVEECS